MNMDSHPKEIFIYQKPNGISPFLIWRDSLPDKKVRLTIQARIDRLSLGNIGFTNSVGDGVHELKIDLGPGYRVYFANDGEHLIILLAGGDKSTQSKDIKQAIVYWQDYKENNP